MSTFRILAAVLAPSLFAPIFLSGVAQAGEPSSPLPPEPGVWQKHEYTFEFLGFTSTYSCDGLADKLKLLLSTAGARSDSTARPGACVSGFGSPDKFARASLIFYTLAPVGPNKNSGDVMAKGVWRKVAISDRMPWDLGVGDCELVDQFRHQVLPMFSTRNVESNTTCIPNQNSGSVIDLKFESFAAAKTKADNAQ